MKWFIYRVKVSYWLVKMGGFKINQAWQYSEGFDDYYKFGENPKDDVGSDLSYYD